MNDSGGRFHQALAGALVVATLLATAGGLAQLAALGATVVGRVTFPFDLEWMEGGVLMHALRLANGDPVYAPPSVDFIPFLHTPGYPALLALLSKVLGLGYALGRGVSVLAVAFALAALIALGARQALPDSPRFRRLPPVLVALAGAGIVAGAYRFTGSFYDLVRSDSLLLALETAAVWFAFARTTRRSAITCAVLIVLAFFTKQTAAVVGIGLGIGLLLTDFRRGLVYGAGAAVLLAGSILVANKITGGWFWRYIFELHQAHDFSARVAFIETPRRIFGHAPALFVALPVVTVALGVERRLRRADFILWLVAAAGFAAGCVGFGTQWAFENAYIPAVYFPALAATVLLARLVGLAVARAGSKTAASFALAATLALAFQTLRPGFPDRSLLVPQDIDRKAGERLITTIRSLPGDVFIPFHPYYAVLAGKRPFVHRMGVMDVGRSGLGRPRGLDEAFVSQRFSHVLLDWKSSSWEWPGLETRYHRIKELRDGLDTARSFSGAETSVRTIFAATSEAPRREGQQVLADFESTRWNGWESAGDAFGDGPRPALGGTYGRLAADSAAGGVAATGTLRSAPFKIDKRHLGFEIAGPADPGLRVLLLTGPASARTTSPTGAHQHVEWDVADLIGRQAVILAEDRSTTSSLVLDHLVAY